MRGHVAGDFFDGAGEMRASFEERFAARRRLAPERFVWDYWHVPGQYTYFRTIAAKFFAGPLYRRFAARLRAWGLEHLGCGAISEPWLSYYIDGCLQELHTDPLQGSWSFVFSLTPWQNRRFRGGETILLRDEVLDYWSGDTATRPREMDAIVERVPAEENQLVVFDSRVPHGVARVEGVHDPLEARLVIHGWFEEPRAAASGFDAASSRRVVAELRERVENALAGESGVSGLLVLRIAIENGRVVRVERPTNLLVSTRHEPDAPMRIARSASEALIGQRAGRGNGSVLLPFRA